MGGMGVQSTASKTAGSKEISIVQAPRFGVGFAAMRDTVTFPPGATVVLAGSMKTAFSMAWMQMLPLDTTGTMGFASSSVNSTTLTVRSLQLPPRPMALNVMVA